MVAGVVARVTDVLFGVEIGVEKADRAAPRVTRSIGVVIGAG